MRSQHEVVEELDLRNNLEPGGSQGRRHLGLRLDRPYVCVSVSLAYAHTLSLIQSLTHSLTTRHSYYNQTRTAEIIGSNRLLKRIYLSGNSMGNIGFLYVQNLYIVQHGLHYIQHKHGVFTTSDKALYSVVCVCATLWKCLSTKGPQGKLNVSVGCGTW